MGGLSRRFLNLVMDNRIRGVRSLRCIDLTRQQFFNTTIPALSPNGKGSGSEGPQDAPTSRETVAVAGSQRNKQVAGDTLKMEKIRLPSPSFSIRGFTSDLSDQLMHFFPIADRRVVCVDQLGRGVLLEADTGNVVIMPPLHKPKLTPISLSVPSPDLDDHDGGIRSKLFVMERILKPEPSSMEQTYQFEAFVYRRPGPTFFYKCWHCQLLPSLPYVHSTKQWHSFPQISSYAVVNGGSEICISVEGLGTYCLNTTSYTWTEVGKWTLPFNGKVEYVPELKLWFGISASDQTLAAADLSAMDSQPQLLGRWKELDLPEEWKECKDSQLINLGSGKFCIVRFLHTTTAKGDISDELIDQNLAVLTGVEVALHAHRSNANASANKGSGRVELKFSNHKSRRYKSNSSNGISAVF
ncbi:hypothetical protein PAHAL_8G016200 [Panicum hallii]|jgi:hypothetical protein|uniref:DUF1618 domain-containing protein n=1 Tax=Panicum hallii TaxID=206008 RepID=A0A2S3ICB3_9POAL|nr:uncharacterized protein LOC112902822 [Panicum hallii]PAN41171.2 hypothetical protein PAHAL_8G016200 [Panicum hallii]